MSRCKVTYIESELAPQLDQAQLNLVIEQILADEDLDQQQLHVLFVNDEDSSALHAQHFNDPSPTDVMSFPDGGEDPETDLTHLGDLAVGVEVAARVAELRGVKAEEEIALYVVHGLLHLLDYDDIDPDDRAEMWALQQRYMQIMGCDIGGSPDI